MSGEEAYVLRFEDAAVADRVRTVLRGAADANPADAAMELDFDETRLVDGDPRHGTLTIGRDRFPVLALDAPTAVEAYATLDDANLVKTGDVGQILLVLSSTAPSAALPPPSSFESRDGVTPPMTDARARHFARRPAAPKADVAAAEEALLRVAGGGAPDGVEFEDVEEEYRPGEGGLGGAWVPVAPSGERKRRGRPPGSKSRTARGASGAPTSGAPSASGAPSGSAGGGGGGGGSEATAGGDVDGGGGGGGDGEVQQI